MQVALPDPCGTLAAIGLEKLPRKAFDVVEGPVTKVAESTVQNDTFMDALAFTWKLQRRAARRVEAGTSAWLRVWGLPTRRDLVGVANQVAGLQRELRELRSEVDSR